VIRVSNSLLPVISAYDRHNVSCTPSFVTWLPPVARDEVCSRLMDCCISLLLAWCFAAEFYGQMSFMDPGRRGSYLNTQWGSDSATLDQAS
jgi:hypothetical protein